MSETLNHHHHHQQQHVRYHTHLHITSTHDNVTPSTRKRVLSTITDMQPKPSRSASSSTGTLTHSGHPTHSSSMRPPREESRSFWNVVVDPTDETSSRNRQSANSHATDSLKSHLPIATDAPRASSTPVPIAPSGPVQTPRDESDGYRFKCPEEGCEQKYRHRSSRSRHRRNVHRPN